MDNRLAELLVAYAERVQDYHMQGNQTAFPQSPAAIAEKCRIVNTYM
jgi:hypothetical protein